MLRSNYKWAVEHVCRQILTQDFDVRSRDTVYVKFLCLRLIHSNDLQKSLVHMEKRPTDECLCPHSLAGNAILPCTCNIPGRIKNMNNWQSVCRLDWWIKQLEAHRKL